MEELHKRLFRPGGHHHPGDDLFYAFVARVACGAQLATRGLAQEDRPPTRDVDTGAMVFHNDERRELAVVPGSTPPVHFHSLVVNTGKALKRFREFVVYDASRVYVEYLLAYRRV